MHKGKVFLFTLLSVYFISFNLFYCKSPAEPENVIVYVEKESIADGLGDHDGIASEEELEFVDNYFIENPEAWCIGKFPMKYKNSKAVPADTVLNSFVNSNLWGPYENAYELRRTFVSIDFTTGDVGVYVIRFTDKYFINKFYYSPGPRISLSTWTNILIQ